METKRNIKYLFIIKMQTLTCADRIFETQYLADPSHILSGKFEMIRVMSVKAQSSFVYYFRKSAMSRNSSVRCNDLFFNLKLLKCSSMIYTNFYI